MSVRKQGFFKAPSRILKIGFLFNGPFDRKTLGRTVKGECSDKAVTRRRSEAALEEKKGNDKSRRETEK